MKTNTGNRYFVSNWIRIPYGKRDLP